MPLLNKLDNVKPRLFLTVVFLLGLIWRLVYFLEIRKDLLFQALLFDARYYHQWAKSILSQGWLGKGIFFVSPLYAYLLALLYRLGFSPQGVKILQLIIDAFIPLLIYFITLKVFNRRIAIISGVLAAIYAPAIFFSGFILKTQLEYLLTTLTILLLLLSQEKPKTHLWFLSGISLGLFTLAKDTGLVLALPVAVWIYLNLKKTPLNPKKATLSFLAGVILVVGILTLRNIIIGKDWVLTTWGGGVNFYYGNCRESDGALKGPDFMRLEPEYEEIDAIKEAQRLTGRPLKPSSVSNFWLRMAIRENITDPGRFLLHLLKKLGLLFNRVGISDNYQMAYFRDRSLILKYLSVDFWPIAILGLTAIAIIVWLRLLNPKLNLILIFFFTHTLVLCLGHIIDRYRQVLIPSLIPLAAFALGFVYNTIEQKDRKKILLSFSFLFVFTLLTALHFPNFDQMPYADAYNQLGLLYHEKRQYPQAENAYRKALEIRPAHLWARQNLADCLLRQGKTEESIKEYKNAILYRPDVLELYLFLDRAKKMQGKTPGEIELALQDDLLLKRIQELNLSEELSFNYRLGLWLFRNSRFDEAIKQFNKILKQKPNSPFALLNLGVIYRQKKEPQKAISCYEGLLMEFPEILPARYNLAMVLMSESKFNEAIPHLEQIVAIFPEFMRAQFYLGTAYQKTGQDQKAIEQYEAIIERSGNSPQERLLNEQLREKIWFMERKDTSLKNATLQNIFLDRRGFE